MSKTVGIKLTDSDYAQWERAAKSERLTLSQWIRSLAAKRLTSTVENEQKVNLPVSKAPQKVNLQPQKVIPVEQKVNPVIEKVNLSIQSFCQHPMVCRGAEFCPHADCQSAKKALQNK